MRMFLLSIAHLSNLSALITFTFLDLCLKKLSYKLELSSIGGLKRRQAEKERQHRTEKQC